MQISDFDYELPPELIAQEPLERRDASRMLVLDRKRQVWADSKFSEFPTFLHKNDIVVINNTRVFPARLIGQRYPSSGHVEVMLVREIAAFDWEALVRPGRRLKKGALLRFGDGELFAETLDPPGAEIRKLRFTCRKPLEVVLDELGATPLPPYIKRGSKNERKDKERYQTVFARMRGAIAAPTAGLHFTRETMKQIRARGNQIIEITLHVGYGTFAPVRVDNVEDHEVMAERFEVTERAARAINDARLGCNRITAVGTTSTRALESAVQKDGKVKSGQQTTELTITPGYHFRVADALLTNFHLPRSSLLLLVCAFAGRELVMEAYRHAIEQRYRFYSYGDCMLIL